MLDLLFGGRKLMFESPLNLQEATTRLQQDLAAPEWRVYENRQQAFVGALADGRFHLMRLVRGKHSFRPMIDGQMSPTVNGCRITARLTLPPGAVVACVLFLVVGVTMFSVALAQILTAGGPSSFAKYFLVLGPTLILISVVVPIVEARTATRLLGTVLNADVGSVSGAGYGRL